MFDSAPGTDEFLAPLNAEQRLAVEHGIGTHADDTRALLVIAGAGSGKTNTLAYRVAHLVRCGADPQRILLLTFSRRAAAEMARRAGQLLRHALGVAAAQESAALRWAGTFHGVGARLLREYASRIGLDESFTVLERDYPRCVPWHAELATLFEAYVAAKQAQHVLDYDDLLLWWAHMVGEPAFAREVGERFDHVLVDEYQDTNRLQAAILHALKPDGRGVTVVGDDAQSIYAFRAATVRNILDFPGRFSPPARVVTLERNYRSTQPILDASNAVIGLARERFTKNLWTDRASSARPRLVSVRDEADQARCVADRVLGMRERGMALKSQAVLFRTSSHSAHLELELARRGIPFVKYGGLRFLEAAHVKDVLSVLRWADNPRHRLAGFRAARLVPGIGPATASRVLEALAASADAPTALREFEAPAAARTDWPPLVALLCGLRGAAAGWPADLDAVVCWYRPHLERLYDDAAVRAGDLAQLAQIASTYASRERFLTELALDPPEATSDRSGAALKDDDYLILSTIHSAKGQEWKSVQVLNVVDGCIPSDMSTATADEVEEERRLLYVAMTRAKEELALLVPQRFHVHQQAAHGDRHVYASRTRFIPDALARHFECCSWPMATPCADESRAARGAAPAIDIAARVRASWR